MEKKQREEAGREVREPIWEIETVYNQKTMTAMAAALRKTIRAKRSGRAHRLGTGVMVLGGFLLAVNALNGEFWTVKSGVTGAAVLAIFMTFLFEDVINGFFAVKRILPGTETANTGFYEDVYVTKTKAGTTEWPYHRIRTLAENGGYLIFVLGENHAQAYDLSRLSGGTREEFRRFLEKAAGQRVISV